MMQTVSVRVPATSANIGPGFDSLGCAFALYNTFTFTRAAQTQVSGCAPSHAGENNLALVAFRRACDYAAVPPPPVALTIAADVPISRGLGSSATLIVGGIVGADLLCGLHLGDAARLRLATEIEGHPDNVAPALRGGFTASLMADGVPHTAALRIHPDYRFCAFIPDFETSTKAARGVLPTHLSYADAIFNVSRMAPLITALAEGDTDLLRIALQDRLHEPYRRSLIPEYDAVRSAAIDEGAHAFFLSGSGSTCMAIYTDPTFPARVAPRMLPLTHAWRTLPLLLDHAGCCPV